MTPSTRLVCSHEEATIPQALLPLISEDATRIYCVSLRAVRVPHGKVISIFRWYSARRQECSGRSAVGNRPRYWRNHRVAREYLPLRKAIKGGKLIDAL